jgi:predicted transcriptional regulator
MAFTHRINAEEQALAKLLYGEKKYTMEEIARRLNVLKSSVWRIIRADRVKKKMHEKNDRHRHVRPGRRNIRQNDVCKGQ